MPCTRQYPLSDQDAPHRVIVFKTRGLTGGQVPFDLIKQQREWLESEDTGCQGAYLDRAYARLDKETNEYTNGHVYKFTDENTAFFFKFRFA